MFSAARLALSEIFSPPFRSVLWKSLGLTIAVLLVIWLGLQGLLGWVIDIQSYPWIETVIAIIAGVGIFIGLGFLVAPAAALLSGLFTDEVATLVEQEHYPADPPGQDLSIAAALTDTIAFTGVVILVNLIALALLLVPGVNLIAFFVGNGYLLGREYFEAAARRFMSRAEARALRRANGGTVFVAGLLIALFLAVPLLNLFTPLFAAAFMVHVYKRLSGSVRTRPA